MQDNDEQRLRGAFERLRDEEMDRLPGYRTIRARGAMADASIPFSIRGWIPAAGVAAAVLLLALWMTPGSRPLASVEWVPGQWAMPSDVLLDLSGLPGSSLMGELEWKPGKPVVEEGAHRNQDLDRVSGRNERSLG
jgi:hypothetical protein